MIVPCIITGVLIIIKNIKNRDLFEEYLVFFNIISCISGLMWSYLATNILIDFLTMIGVITQLSSTYLGLTILAIGNALPDGLTVIALSKKGMAEMAITGVYAG
jgi:sodium/potassium/calcium exchanger 6